MSDLTAQPEKGHWGRVDEGTEGRRIIRQSDLRQFCLDPGFWFSSSVSESHFPNLLFPFWKFLWVLYSGAGLSATPGTRAPDNRAAALEEQKAKDLGQLCQEPGHGLLHLAWSRDAVSQPFVWSWRGLSSGSIWTAEIGRKPSEFQRKKSFKNRNC